MKQKHQSDDMPQFGDKDHLVPILWIVIPTIVAAILFWFGAGSPYTYGGATWIVQFIVCPALVLAAIIFAIFLWTRK